MLDSPFVLFIQIFFCFFMANKEVQKYFYLDTKCNSMAIHIAIIRNVQKLSKGEK